MQSGSDLVKVKADPAATHSREMDTTLEKKIRLPLKLAAQTETIIKAKVRSMAHNWQLHEKLFTMKEIRERQKQNLVDRQMLYEQLDGAHQGELKERERTVYKVKVAKKLHELMYINVMDQKESQKQHSSLMKKTLDDFQCIEHEVRKKTQMYAKCQESFVNAENDYETKTQELQRSLNDSRARINEDRISRNSSCEVLDKHSNYLQKQETAEIEIVNTLIEFEDHSLQFQNQLNLKNLQLEEGLFRKKEDRSTELTKMKTFILNHKNVINHNSTEKETLRNALVNQENFTTVISKNGQQLLKKKSDIEKEMLNLNEQKKQKSQQLDDIKHKCDVLKSKIANCNLILKEKDQIIDKFASEIKFMVDRKTAIEKRLDEEDAEISDEYAKRMEQKSHLIAELENNKMPYEARKSSLKEMEAKHENLKDELNNLENKITAKTTICEKIIAEVFKNIEQIDKDLEEICVTVTQRETDVSQVTEKLMKLKEDKEKQQKRLQENRKELATKLEQLELNKSDNDRAQKNLESIAVEKVKLNDQMNEIILIPTTKKDFYAEQMIILNQEKADLLIKKDNLNQEMLKHKKILEDIEALLNKKFSLLSEKLQELRETQKRDVAEKKVKVSELQKQITTNANHVFNLKSDRRQAVESGKKSEVAFDMMVREIANKKVELQIIREETEKMMEAQIAETKELNEQLKSAYESSNEKHKENVDLKAKLKSVLNGNTTAKKRKSRVDKQKTARDGRTSSVLKPILSNTTERIQANLPTLQSREPKKTVRFAIPKKIVAVQQKTSWDYFSDSSDGGYSMSAVHGTEPPTKEISNPPPLSPTRENKFSSSRRPFQQRIKRFKATDDS